MSETEVKEEKLKDEKPGKEVEDVPPVSVSVSRESSTGEGKPQLLKPNSVMTESTGSYEPVEPHDSSLNQLARNMFEKSAEYLQGELLQVQEDYRLLENLNIATAAKYSDMRQISGNVAKRLEELNEKFRSLAPLLLQIDQIEESVNKLEQAAYKLDKYSKRLETKFKQLEKR